MCIIKLPIYSSKCLYLSCIIAVLKQHPKLDHQYFQTYILLPEDYQQNPNSQTLKDTDSYPVVIFLLFQRVNLQCFLLKNLLLISQKMLQERLLPQKKFLPSLTVDLIYLRVFKRYIPHLSQLESLYLILVPAFDLMPYLLYSKDSWYYHPT